MEFEAHVEPLICRTANKEEITRTVVEKIINPVLELINLEGENDEVLNYNAEDNLRYDLLFNRCMPSQLD